MLYVVKLGRKTTRDQTNNLAVGLVDTYCGQYVELPFDTSEQQLRVLISLHIAILIVLLEVVPLGIITRLVPVYNGLLWASTEPVA